MKSNLKPIRDYIRLVDNRNTGNAVKLLLGMNIKKEFMPSVANIKHTDLSKYKIIKKNQFAYSPMQTGRDETIRIALYGDHSPAIISPAYSVFEIIDTEVLLPEFVMIYFLRTESDRYGWFISDSSVRANLDWERFAQIELPIPSMKTQIKYVNLYNSLIDNQRCYEESLGSLRFICDSFIEDQISKGTRKRLGEYIRQIETRNSDSSNRNVLGISVKKVFMPSRANRDDLDVSNYKVIKSNQFGYVSVTSRNGERISIALLDGPEGVISSTYTAFEVIDLNTILPEYLYLWFSRDEFDRYARYHSWGSARETFDWQNMCDVELPIPSIEKQKSIVAIHRILEERKKINEKLKATIRPLCPVITQGVLKDLQAEKE